jgi:predicted membrane-bound spermidine synthase
MLILFLFFCSGATALIYEVLWSKYLAILLGSTIQAQTVVLAVFMGGLALGNKLFGSQADRTQKPLVIYGRIEIAIGLYAFFFPVIYGMADSLFVSAGSRLLDHTGWLLLLKGILSAGLMLGPTVLMGGTLPILSAWLEKNTADAGRRSARFYSINSFGAVCGAGLAGFFLVEQFGMAMTMKLTAVVNVLIGLAAINLGKSESVPVPSSESKTEITKPTTEQPEMPSNIFRWGCVLVALTGGISMGLEILASRCLALIFGASLQVFAIVLMAFILGISFGSAVISSPRCRNWPKELTTIVLLLGAAVLIGLVVFNIENLAAIYLYAQSGLQRTAVGYCYHQILASVVSIVVLGLPAAALGSVLPLWIRASEASHLLGDRVGRLVTWNTLGAVVGVLLTGFVLMPQIGLRGSFAVVALILAVAAIVMAKATCQSFAVKAGIVIAVLVALVAVGGGQDWRDVFSIGIFRLSDEDINSKGGSLRSYMAGWRQNIHLLFYEDAADATVSVERVFNSIPDSDETVLRINGKPDASAGDNPAFSDAPTQILLAQLPLMSKPDSKDVFCFGMGSGVTAGSTLGYPIEHLTIAENCEPVLRAVRLFDRWNGGVATNSRVRIRHEDARTVLKLDAKQYDVIISEPSNPWMVGVGSVFTREFYQLAASRLKPGGIMTQWFHMYEMDDETLNLVLRTFGTVFPNMEIWDVGDEDVVLLGSNQPWESSPGVYQRAFTLDGPRHDLALIGLTTPEAILTRQFASQRTAFAVAGPGPVQSDNHPLLEYAAPRAFYLFHGHRGVNLLQHYDERTWQVGIAPSAKNKVLASLDITDLVPIFGKGFGSGNQELQDYLDNRFQGHFGNLTFGNRIMPSIFQGTNNSVPVYSPPSAATNIIARQLYNAEVILRSDPTRQLEAIEGIESALYAVQHYRPQESDWSAAYYTALAVRASVRVGATAQAKAILLRGLQLEPDSDELKYLSRILIREGIVQSSEVSPVGVK